MDVFLSRSYSHCDVKGMHYNDSCPPRHTTSCKVICMLGYLNLTNETRLLHWKNLLKVGFFCSIKKQSRPCQRENSEENGQHVVVESLSSERFSFLLEAWLCVLPSERDERVSCLKEGDSFLKSLYDTSQGCHPFPSHSTTTILCRLWAWSPKRSNYPGQGWLIALGWLSLSPSRLFPTLLQSLPGFAQGFQSCKPSFSPSNLLNLPAPSRVSIIPLSTLSSCFSLLHT